MTDALRATLAGSMGEFFASHIGAAYESRAIGPMSHKILHAASGAIGAKIMGRDAISGAFGAAVAETLEESLIHEAPQTLERLVHDNPTLTPAELKDLYMKEVRGRLDIIKLETAALAFLMKQEVGAATDQAINALENNCLPLLAVIAARALIQAGAGAALKAGGRAAAAYVGKKAAQMIAKRALKKLVQEKLPANIKKDAWVPDAEALKKVPEGLGKAIKNQKGVGYRWVGRKGSNIVRIDKGDPKGNYPHERIDHVRVNVNGKMMGRDGNLLPTGTLKNVPEAHIPLEEWIKWTAWNVK